MRIFLLLLTLHASLACALAQASKDSSLTIAAVTVRASRILRVVSMSAPWDTAKWQRIEPGEMPADTTKRFKKPRE